MWVMDVRLPPEPAVPVVPKSAPGAGTLTTPRTPLEHRYDRARRRFEPDRLLGLFTGADLELVRAATGQDLRPGRRADDEPLSDFATQLLFDRRSGRLHRHREVTSGWLLAMSAALARMGAANPYAGDPLRRALRYLRSREAGGIDVVL